MKFKKIPYNILLILLTSGVGLIFGFLSFGGMLALFPTLLPIAIIAFFLSGFYESEIFGSGIGGGLHKLFQPQYLQKQLAKQFLLEFLPAAIKDGSAPESFVDYANLLNRLHKYSHKNLSQEDKKKKKQIKKQLKKMENWFADQLFTVKKDDAELTGYAGNLQTWLAENERKEKYTNLLQSRKNTYIAVKIFSLATAAFMTVGTTYLLVESLTAIPFLSFIPFSIFPAFVIPMALVAGIAYGLLTYNAITDMINNETLKRLYHKIKDLVTDINFINIVKIAFSVFFLLLVTALTICTAGTWWTVVKTAQPLFSWMTKIPSFIMGVINPIITGLSQLVFNLENASHTIDMLIEEGKESFWQRLKNKISNAWNTVMEEENIWQIINPFRLIINLTLFPVRVILFIGHIVSMGVTEDRVPGIPELVSAGANVGAEAVTDGHFFFGSEHKHDHSLKGLLEERFGMGHSHNHDDDIPTRVITFLFYPLFFLAASWDYLASLRNSTPEYVLTPLKAWNKQLGINTDIDIVKLTKTKPISENAMKELALYKIDSFQKKHLKEETAEVLEEKKALQGLKAEIKQAATPTLALKDYKVAYGNHSFFKKAEQLEERFAAAGIAMQA